MPQENPAISPAAAYVEAAWLHARSFIAERGFVPDVMVLGRYADEELCFVFPSSQDKALFQTACAAEAASFGADIAMLVGEALWTQAGQIDQGKEIVKVLYRERGQPLRAEIAFIGANSDATRRTFGPISGIPGMHSEPLLDTVFPNGALH